MFVDKDHNEDGFSLPEILIGVAILGILFSIAVFGFQKLREKGNEAEIEKEVSSAQTQIQTYWTGAQKVYPLVSSNNLPVTKNGEPVYTPESKNIKFKYSVTSNRKDYCIEATLGKEKFYFKKSVGEKTTPQVCS